MVLPTGSDSALAGMSGVRRTLGELLASVNEKWRLVTYLKSRFRIINMFLGAVYYAGPLRPPLPPPIPLPPPPPCPEPREAPVTVAETAAGGNIGADGSIASPGAASAFDGASAPRK